MKWQKIFGEVFRINSFDKNGTIIDRDGIHPKDNFSPYGYLICESPIIDRKVKIPIVHRDDFLLASSVFDDSKLMEEIESDEILVTYLPAGEKFAEMAPFLHSLHYVITSAFTLEVYYKMKKSVSDLDARFIFGDFKWDGELRVNINTNPSL
jgi:hypothetical protein